MSDAEVVVPCPEKLAEILDKLLGAYIDALVISTAALGLEGEWGYDSRTKMFVRTVAPVTTPPTSPPTA